MRFVMYAASVSVKTNSFKDLPCRCTNSVPESRPTGLIEGLQPFRVAIFTKKFVGVIGSSVACGT